jgi:hypothetical protein
MAWSILTVGLTTTANADRHEEMPDSGPMAELLPIAGLVLHVAELNGYFGVPLVPYPDAGMLHCRLLPSILRLDPGPATASGAGGGQRRRG